MRQNLSKERLRDGKAILGIHIPFAAPAVVEFAAAAGFHWVLIDCEHGPMNHETVETMIRAAESTSITPIVRPPRNEASAILRYLDMGAQGIFVPNIQSRVDAEAAVRHAKFYPTGRRGLGPYARWARQRPVDTPLSEAIRRANEEIMVTLLVESVQGVACLDEILQVDGVDEIHLGLADLSQSLGCPGDVDGSAVQACAAQALGKILGAGRTAGMGAGTPEQARQFLEQGVRSVLAGAHTLFLAAGRQFTQGCGTG